MLIIDHKTKQSDFDKCSRVLADSLNPYIESTPHFCSQMIRMKAVNLLLMIADTLDRPVNEILQDEEKLGALCNAKFFTETMAACLSKLNYNLNASIILKYLDGKDGTFNNVQAWLDEVEKDFVAFSLYCIYEGASPDCCRKYINKKYEKIITEMRKRMSLSDFISQLDRSLHVFNIIRTKLFEPKFEALHATPLDDHYCDAGSVNSMSACFASIRK